MPRGFRTANGPRPDLELTYGMMEHSSPEYPPRTFSNVAMSDATLIFGYLLSRGCVLTKRYAEKAGKPLYVFPWKGEYPKVVITDFALVHFLSDNRVRILNVAGNRERNNHGITEAIRQYLLHSLRNQNLPVPF